MAPVKKRRVCLRIEEALFKELEQLRKKTGIPVSTQIELRFEGSTIPNTEERRNWDKIWERYSKMEKDKELVDKVNKAVTGIGRRVEFIRTKF